MYNRLPIHLRKAEFLPKEVMSSSSGMGSQIVSMLISVLLSISIGFGQNVSNCI